MPRYEHSGSAVASTLSTSITSVSTTINIVTTTGWPTGAVGPFWVTIDAGTASEEKVLILSRTGGSLTVSARGQDGTTATSHASGASITHTFSATEADAANAHVENVTSAHGLTTNQVVTLTGTQTLTNKTHTSPTLNSPTVTGGTFDTPLGRRNVIRNGDMGVAQRGNGPINGSVPAAYGLDGWALEKAGNGTATQARVAAPIGGSATNAGWALQTAVSGASAAGDYTLLRQRIEDVRTLAGKEVTLSFVAYASAGTPKIGVEVEQHFGTGGAPSATVQTAVQAVQLSTVATRYTVTSTVPSIAGKTLGTGGNDFLSLNLWLSAGATYAARASSIGIQNATINITDVQLEQGSLTAFERLSQAEQLAWCQRYFVRTEVNGGSAYIAFGSASGTTQAYVRRELPVRMRALPTLTATVPGNFALNDLVNAAVAVTALALSTAQCTTESLLLAATTAGGLTVYRPFFLHSQTTGGYLDLSAEL